MKWSSLRKLAEMAKIPPITVEQVFKLPFFEDRGWVIVRMDGVGWIKRSHAVMLATGWVPKHGDNIHHKNGNKHDDSPENLEVLSRSRHMLLHSVGRSPSFESRMKTSSTLFGHYVSAETRRRISARKAGKPWSDARMEAQMEAQRRRHALVESERGRRTPSAGFQAVAAGIEPEAGV